MEFPLAPGLILLIVAGWLWADTFLPLKWRYKRSEGNRLYFAAVLHGVWLGAVVFLAIVLLNTFGVLLKSVFCDSCAWPRFSIEKLNLTETRIYLVVSLVIPFTYGLIRFANRWFINKSSRVLGVIRALYKDTDELSLLMLESVIQRRPMIFTLSSGKVYIGQATEIPAPESDKETITFMPIVSGQRRSDGTIEYTTPYFRLDEKTGGMIPRDTPVMNEESESREPLMLTIAIQHIVTFHLYNFDAYTAAEIND